MLDAPIPNFPMLKLFVITMSTPAAIIIVGQIWVRLANREDARAKPDNIRRPWRQPSASPRCSASRWTRSSSGKRSPRPLSIGP